MSSTVEIELVDVFKREVEELAQTSGKYYTLEAGDIDAILRAFSLAINQENDGATAQRLFEAINRR